MVDTIDACPLCLGTSGTFQWSATYAQIWTALEREWGVRVTTEVRAPYDEVGSARLYRCNACGLRYFSPLLPGPPAFYEQMSQNPGYYDPARWEFGVVSSRLKANDRVLDFGAGDGAFVRQIAPHVAEAIGVDSNPRLFSATGSPHPGVLSASFQQIADSFAGQIDVATAFQVLEHLDSVATLCAPAAKALRAGGTLFISTPNRRRTAQRPLEPLDCPPHHVSRWSGELLGRLGERFQLEPIAVYHQPFLYVRGPNLRTLMDASRRLRIPAAVTQAVWLLGLVTSGRRISRPTIRSSKRNPWLVGADMILELRKPQ